MGITILWNNSGITNATIQWFITTQIQLQHVGSMSCVRPGVEMELYFSVTKLVEVKLNICVKNVNI